MQRALSKFWPAIATILIGIAVFIIPQFMAAFIVYSIAVIFGISEDTIQESTFVQFVFTSFSYLLVILFLLWWMKMLQETWRSIGVKKPRFSDFKYTIGGLFLYWAVYFVGIGLVSLLVTLDFGQKQEIGFSTDAAGIDTLLIFITLVVFAPIVEEIIFRGFLYTRFRRIFSVKWAAVAISLLFASLHLQLDSGNAPLWVAAIDTLFLSLVLVYLREKTGHIWAGVGLHALKNCIAFITLFVLHAT